MSSALVHVDASIVVIDKPAGLLSVPGRGAANQDCASARLQAEFPDAMVVHRLDMATSGLLLFARGAEMQRRLSRAFADRSVHKRYEAVVHGAPAHDAGEIDLPLASDWPNRPRQRVDRDHGKPSLTRYRVLENMAAAHRTRLALEPVTGRAHQLRVHLMSIGHAIVGDALYGPSDETPVSPRLLLHATELAFAHPSTGEALRFESTAPF